MRILWVDDEIDELKTYVKALRDKKYIVDTAKDANKVMELVNINNYDIALVDIKMPKPDGIEILRRIHKKKPNIKLGALSSYLYEKKYIERLKVLDFDVQIIDKDFPPIYSEDFEIRFINPIRSLADTGIFYTVNTQEDIIRKEYTEDPFDLHFDKYLQMSMAQKKRLLLKAQDLAKDTINNAFSKGIKWLLLCGSRDKIIFSVDNLGDIPLEEEVMDIARKKQRAPYQFTCPLHVEDIWCSNETKDSLVDYPTVSLMINNHELHMHFDTGSPTTFFSYEKLLELRAILPTTDFNLGSRSGNPYFSKHFVIKTLLKDQRSKQTVALTLNGQAIQEWIQSPFARPCYHKCDHPTNNDGYKHKPGDNCYLRLALIGRDMLTKNNISLILDGKIRKTGFEI